MTATYRTALALAIILVAHTLPGHAARQGQNSQVAASSQNDKWILDTSFGFPVRIAYDSSRLITPQYGRRMIFLWIHHNDCSPDHLRTVFVALAERYQEDSLEIDVYSDPEMLRRAIERYQRDPDDMHFPDTPEGAALEKRIRGDLYIPKTGWARARYFRSPKTGESFLYKPDPQKIDMTEVVLKPKPGPHYTGDLQDDLFLASQLGDLTKAEYLIAHGAKIGYKSEFGETALVFAVGHNSLDIVKLLLTHGAGVDEKNMYGQTGLSVALSHGFYEVFRILLDHKADVNARYGPGISPLHLAAYKANAEAVEALLSKGADPNAADADGNTPLFDAIRTRQLRSVTALLQSGALGNVKNNRGDTPLDLANKIGDQSIIDVLRNSDERPKRNPSGSNDE